MSPLNHIDQLSTPVAFFHGEEDPVVPLTQSIQLHEALKKKGIPTSLTVFPGNFECYISEARSSNVYLHQTSYVTLIL